MNYIKQDTRHNCISVVALIYSLLACFSVSSYVKAAPVVGLAEAKEVRSVTSASFDVWLTEQKRLLEKERQLLRIAGKKDKIITPDALESAFFERLTADRQISDEAIQTLVFAWGDYDNFYNSQAERKELRYTEGLRIIRKLIASFPQRHSAQVFLYNREAVLLKITGDIVNASKSFAKADDLMIPLRWEYDNQGNRITLNLADSFELIGEPEKADALYFKVFGYPFYRASDSAQYNQIFKDQYIAAARGLIRVRRYQLDKLKHIHLYGFVRDTVGKELEDAIAEATHKAE